MPANLNALIRYKTINSCLAGGRRKWSIDELRQRCSEALAENRGRYGAVSERTIRDDIRVMRSDILGFNAPIKQEGGLYYYSEAGYSILSLRITDEGLAEQILELLIKMRDKVNHPEMEVIMKKLSNLIGREYEPLPAKPAGRKAAEEAIPADKAMLADKVMLPDGETLVDKAMLADEAILADKVPEAEMDIHFNISEAGLKIRSQKLRFTASRIRRPELIWGEIMAAVMA